MLRCPGGEDCFLSGACGMLENHSRDQYRKSDAKDGDRNGTEREGKHKLLPFGKFMVMRGLSNLCPPSDAEAETRQGAVFGSREGELAAVRRRDGNNRERRLAFLCSITNTIPIFGRRRPRQTSELR